MRFEVSTRGLPPQRVEAPNWLAALGLGIDQLGVVASIDRLACEVLPNGKVLARDVRSGLGFVVEPREGPAAGVGPAEGDDEDTVLVGADPADEPLEMGADDSMAPPAGAVEEESAELLPEDALDLLPCTDEDFFARLAALPASSRTAARAALAGIREAPSRGVACEQALDLARRLVPCLAGSVILATGDGALRFIAVAGPKSELLRGVKLPAGKGLAGFCVARGTSLVLTRPRVDPRFYAAVDEVTGLDTECILCVPVGEVAPVRGCIELLNPRGGSFRPGDQQLLLRVAAELESRLAGA